MAVEAADARAEALRRVTRGRALAVVDAALRSYAEILFCRSRVVGGILLAATLLDPQVGLTGLGAALLAAGLALSLRFGEDAIKDGLYGYNALLAGLGVGATLAPSPGAYALGIVAVIGTVIITAALHSYLTARSGLPILALPFLIVMTLVVLATPVVGVEQRLLAPHDAALALPLPDLVTGWLQSLGAIFFLPRADVGAVVLIALIAFSRIATLLSILAFAAAVAFGSTLDGALGGYLSLMVGYNFILVAIALGGVWFVPSLSSFALAALGVAVSGLLTVGLLPVLVRFGIPLLVLPFVVTVLAVLLAMRQRVRDGAPKAVDFLLGTPEENLSYLRTRLARFGAHYVVRFRAPFLGRWTCTQGVDGQESHFGPWRYALDFEVLGDDGSAFRGAGKKLEEFHCYRLPVVAPADGTVVQVTDNVPDNSVGETNLRENWGNLVMLHHGLGVYSMACHLAPRSIKVARGQVVRRGDEIGACGSSGRSPVPHLHFQIQATARVGAPTLVAELHDVISIRPEGDRLLGTFTPEKGDVVRNIETDQDLERLLRFPYGEVMAFARDGEEVPEQVVPDIDLYGNLLLRSDRGGVLYYEHEGGLFTVFDALGPQRSVLHLIHAALGRVPLDPDPGLEWTDHLPPRLTVPTVLRPLQDLVSPFFRRTGTEIRYAISREGMDLVVEGRSVRLSRSGEPLVSTAARLRQGKGVVQLTVTARGRTHRAERVAAPDTGVQKKRRAP